MWKPTTHLKYLNVQSVMPVITENTAVIGTQKNVLKLWFLLCDTSVCVFYDVVKTYFLLA